MARLVTEGAECGELGPFWSYIGGVITANPVRTGTYSWEMGSRYGGATNYRIVTKTLASMSEFYIRFAWQQTGATYGTGDYLCTWLSGANVAGGMKINLFNELAGTFEMYDGTTSRVTSTPARLQTGEWNVFELHVKLAATPNGIFQAKLNGHLLIDWTGTTNGSYSTVDNIRFWHQSSTSNGGLCYIDDIAINNTTTANDNSWPGDGGVLAALVPMTGAATYSDLIASTGNAWDCVNEKPASATDYAYESTVDKKSTYLLTNLAGLPSGASIARVWMEIGALESAAAGGKIATLLRSGSTDSQGTDQLLSIAQAKFASAEYLVDPADSAAWDSTKVNALEAGAVVR